MSKRHQSSRRKAYGRRQHELRERTERSHLPERMELGWDEARDGNVVDPFAFLDPRSPRLRYAVGE